ncbi:MAG: polysaccharide deacetylase family protein [Clostridia bacterium]|nr:polysaccharide deacetylase family protein [Clostridia bacterium]
MKKTRRRITLITNLILVTAFTVVFAVSFFPQQALPIYGGTDLSAIYSGARGTNKVSFMFNVYENAETVEKIADLLTERGAKATFFVGGCWADDNGKTLKYLIEQGYEIANHGYFHKDHSTLNYEKNKEEIYLTGVIVNALCGAKLNLFAPPSGSFSDTTLQAAADLDYQVVMWSKDTIDWRDSDKAKIVSRATKNLTGGDLILMHPKSHTLAALPEIIDYCFSHGFDIVSVSENISSKITQNI